MSRHLLVVLLAFAAIGSRTGEASRAQSTIEQRFERLAGTTTHFATGDFVFNRWSDRRWPADLLQEQKALLADLKAASGDRQTLLDLLRSPNPRVRTLALGALFVREDPQDLPSIAALGNDRARTFTRLGWAMTSAGGPLPLSDFESEQTVGDVAAAMIHFYFAAADVPSPLDHGGPADTGTLGVPFPSSVFETYWAAHGGRARCLSWFLVKMQRATRRTEPLQPEYESDVRRVLAEIDALPPAERAWTLLYRTRS